MPGMSNWYGGALERHPRLGGRSSLGCLAPGVRVDLRVSQRRRKRRLDQPRRDHRQRGFGGKVLWEVG